jgi:O-antigen/teichoic acid export membrane protein
MKTRNPKPGLSAEARRAKAENWRYIDDTLKNRMKKNTVTNIIYFILTFPLMFIITPLILKHVGKEVYGIWALTGTILVFVELFGGIQTPSALSVLVPKYDPKRQHRDINELTNTMFFFYAAAAILFGIIYFFAQGAIISAFFKVRPGLIPTTQFVLGFSVILFLLNFVLMGFGYLMGSFNIFYIVNIMHIITAFLRVILMAAALIMGYGIQGVVVAQMGTLLLESIVTLVYTKIVFPPLGFGIKYFSLKKLKDLLGLSVKLVFAKMSSLVNFNIDKLVLGYFLNPVMAAYYQLGSSVSKYISQVPDMLGLSSLLPAASELRARGMLHKVSLLYDRVNKYIFFFALYLLSGILIFGREFTGLWLGAGYDDAYMVMIFLAAGYTYSLVGYAASNILNGLEKVNETMTVSIISAAINVVLSAILTYKFGLRGALAGTLISIVIGASLLYLMFFRILRHRMNIWNVFLKPAIAALFGFAGIYFIQQRLLTAHAWPVFLAKGILYTALYFSVCIFVLRHFDSYDMDLVRGYLPFLKKTADKGE